MLVLPPGQAQAGTDAGSDASAGAGASAWTDKLTSNMRHVLAHDTHLDSWLRVLRWLKLLLRMLHVVWHLGVVAVVLRVHGTARERLGA